MSKRIIDIIFSSILICTVFICIMWPGMFSAPEVNVQLVVENTTPIENYSENKLLLPNEKIRIIQWEQDKITATSMQYVFMNTICNFPSGSEAGNVRIENQNHNTYAVTLDLIESISGESIMTTGLIDPGYFVEYKQLDKDLNKGAYICTAVFTLYELDTLQYVGTASTQVQVNIKA